jgi:hypothetical protein
LLTALLQQSKLTREKLAKDSKAKAAAAAKVAAEQKRPPAAPAPIPAPVPVQVAAVPSPPETVVYELPASAPPQVLYFYGALQPYGSWLQVSGHGWCWQPSVATTSAGWRPYADRGRWIYSDAGWYWQSDYSWGWAAFHYGRWLQNPQHGWVWAPDTHWGPAWVSWRSDENYAGWAPLPPGANYVPGRGLVYHDHVVGADFDFGLNPSHFTFVPFGEFGEHNPSQHALSAAAVQSIYVQSKVINNFTTAGNGLVNLGLPLDHVAAMSRTEIHRATVLSAAEAPGGAPHFDRMERMGADIVIFRPDLKITQPVRQPGGGLAVGVASASVPAHALPEVAPSAPAGEEVRPGSPLVPGAPPATSPQTGTANPDAQEANRRLLERAGITGFEASREHPQRMAPAVGFGQVFPPKNNVRPVVQEPQPEVKAAAPQPAPANTVRSAVPAGLPAPGAPYYSPRPSPQSPANTGNFGVGNPGNAHGKQQN